MIETLNNLKNNKLKRNTAHNQGGEAMERMKKLVSGLGKKRHGLSTLDIAHPPRPDGTLQSLHMSRFVFRSSTFILQKQRANGGSWVRLGVEILL
jgi:hypothetical protein